MGSFKLGGMTLKSLFTRPETIMYPAQQRYRPAGLKGHIEIDVEKCILCSMCQKACPSHSITVDKPGETWTINPFSCVQCRACVEACPKDALTMADTYTAPATRISEKAFEVHPKKPQRKPRPAAADAPAKAAEAAAGVAAAPASAEAKPAPAKPAPPAVPDAEAPAKPKSSIEEQRAAMEARIANMDPEKAAKVRAGFEAKVAKLKAAQDAAGEGGAPRA